jgi:hypothetical protein
MVLTYLTSWFNFSTSKIHAIGGMNPLSGGIKVTASGAVPSPPPLDILKNFEALHPFNTQVSNVAVLFSFEI